MPVSDDEIMQECLALARQAEGRTAPNPAVGAIVLDASGVVVGRGFHAAAGTPHAEVGAFDQAGARARGGTLYVTLEPCCHHGRTPPCLERVLEAGVARVVIGVQDANPIVAGKSVEALRAAGVSTTVGVMERECKWLNRGFGKRMRTGLPWVVLKMAATLDGRIADRAGSSRWITGAQSRAVVHGLRNTLDCVLVGSGTVIADDPQLTVREVEGGRNPVRAVVDSRLRCSAGARLFTDGEAKTFVFAGQDADGRLDGCEVVRVGSTADGKLDLQEVLKGLGERGVNTVLAEGGAGLAGALLDAGCVDEVYWFVAPKLLVDNNAIPSLAGEERALAAALELKHVKVQQLGADVLITGVLAELF